MSNCLNSCEYQCPYFKDLKRSCPNPSGLKPETAIQGCAEIVSRTTLESPSKMGGITAAQQAYHDQTPGSRTLWEAGTDRVGMARTLRKIGIPEDSDLEL